MFTRPASRPSLADPLPVRAPGLCIGTVVSGSAALLWIAQAALLAAAVQRLAQGDGLQAVILPALGYALLGLARASAEAWGTRRVFRAARQSLTRQRALAAAALASRSPLDPGRPASGQAASVLAEQADALLPWLSRYQPTRWRVMLVPPVIAAVVAWQSWLAALILLLAAPLIPLTMAFVGWRAKAASEEHLQALGGMNAFLLDRLRGLSTLRALRAVGLTAQRLRTSAEDLRERTMRVLRIAFLSSAALELFSALAVALVAVYVGFHLLGEIGTGAWGQRLTLGEGLFVLLLAPAFFEPLRELSAVWHDRAAGQAAQEALGALQDPALPLPGALDAADLEPPAAVAAPALHLKGVGFAHAGQAPVLEDLHLHIGAGEHVALVGPSGCGKTTLLSLLAGLVPATAGEVWIGHQRLDVQNAPALRRRIAWIGQQPHVFSASLHDNVALGRPGMDVQRVAAALQQSALGPLAPQRSLGEGGAGLSGGERVRLALARAAASPSADLWLVDEPTAHLDSETASAITQSLLQLARGRTLIVATHDLALAARIGRVIHLDATYTLRRAA